MNKQLLFVIVIYNLDFHQSSTYQTLLLPHSDIPTYIIDNSLYSQIVQDSNVIFYSHHPDNPGVSFAYNEAAKYAKENGYEWMLLLDQDTHFPNGILQEYLDCIRSRPDIHLIAPPVNVSNGRYMSPVKLWWKMGLINNNVPKGQIISLYDYSPINSGMCISVDAFFKCGGYKNQVFLDYSDFQFIERFRRISDKGYILKTEIHQEFSTLVDDRDKMLSRYQLFCLSLKQCDMPSFVDRMGYAMVVLKRGVSLILKTHSFRPVLIFFKYYQMTKSRLVIFDICGTLFFSNTSFDFLDLIVQAKSYSLFRKVSKTIFARIINKVSVLLLKKDLIRSIAVLYIKGMSKAELQEKADIFYNQYLLPLKIDNSFDKIEFYRKDSNTTIILASATFDFIADVVANRLEIPIYFGTELAYDNQGIFKGKILKDRLGHKYQALNDMGLKSPFYKVITDNITDMDIINCSKTVDLIIYPWTEKKWSKRKSSIKAVIEDERRYNY